jgi:hypothetical protein
MKFPNLLGARFRGFRIVNLLGATIFLVIAVGSYALKTFAGAQDAGAADVESQIVLEQKRIKMLKVEVAHLGNPTRLAQLSRQYLSLAPEDPRREVAPGGLPSLASGGGLSQPAPGAAAAPQTVIPSPPADAEGPPT